MRIRLTRTLGRDFPEQHREGDEVTVTDDFGESLVRQGLAERLDDALMEMRGVPPEQEIEGTVEKATEDVAAYQAKARRAKHK